MSKLKITRPRHYLLKTTDRTGWCGAYLPQTADRRHYTFSSHEATCSLCRRKLNVEAVTKRLKE